MQNCKFCNEIIIATYLKDYFGITFQFYSFLIFDFTPVETQMLPSKGRRHTGSLVFPQLSHTSARKLELRSILLPLPRMDNRFPLYLKNFFSGAFPIVLVSRHPSYYTCSIMFTFMSTQPDV